MAKRRRYHLLKPEPLDGVIGRAGEDRFALKRAPISDRVWADVVGGRIAERARPITLERGVLTVRAATSVWASELSMLSDALVKRLRAAGFDVRELRFRVGAIEPPARPPERRVSRRVPPPAPLPNELAATVASVADIELRESIAAAARANLAWQRHVTPPTEPPPDRPVPSSALSEAPPAARAPRGAGTRSAPPARTSRASRGAAPGNREGD